jgi:ABC-type lipoprotein export system ATPase subunit
VLLNGRITSQLSDPELSRLRREHVGFISQSFQLLQTLSAVENVELPLLLARQPNARKCALERLAWVDLTAEAERFPHQLSGGQQQRVAIARAIVHEPALLLADEPTGNLDTATSAIVLDLLQRASRDLGVAVLIATHNQEIADLADRIIRVRDGFVEEVSSADLRLIHAGAIR